MALIVPTAARSRIRALITNKTPGNLENLVLRLFKNDYTPVVGSATANFTESNAAGYAAVTLTAANWTDADPTISYPVVSFTYTATETLYGYYVTGATSGLLWWAERFTTAPESVIEDQVVKVTLNLSLSQ